MRAVNDIKLVIFQGFNCCPLLYSVDPNGQISFVSKLDTTQKKEAAGLR